MKKEVVGEGKGLYANIHAKRKRGEKMRSKGDKGAPTEKDLLKTQQKELSKKVVRQYQTVSAFSEWRSEKSNLDYRGDA